MENFIFCAVLETIPKTKSMYMLAYGLAPHFPKESWFVILLFRMMKVFNTILSWDEKKS